jgi:hypothetical protein
VIETELKSFEIRAFSVEVNDSGDVLAISHRERPDDPYLQNLRLAALVVDGHLMPWTSRECTVDADEVEQEWRAGEVAAVTVRHSLADVWRSRLVLRNESDHSISAQVVLSAGLGPAVRTWSLAEETTMTYAFLPFMAFQPILYTRCSSPCRVTSQGSHAELGPIDLEAGQRFVMTWDWGDANSPRRLAEQLRFEHPRWVTVPVGAEIRLIADPDTALVAPAKVTVSEDEDHVALTATTPGRHRVELRSASGSRAFEFGWVTAPLDFLSSAAERALRMVRPRRGIAQIDDVATALVVQRAVRTIGFPAATEAADALDLFTARLLRPDEAAIAGVLSALYLAGEYDRLGSEDPLDGAVRQLTELLPAAAPIPGLGLALMRIGLASVLAGRPPSIPAAATTRLTADDVTAAVRSPSVAVAASVLELSLAIGRPGADSQAAIAELLYRLGIELSAGLPGRIGFGLTAVELGHFLAVLRLAPEELNHGWLRWFGCPLAELTDALACELVERLESEPISVAHAWLAIAS